MRRSGRRARASLTGGGDACAVLIPGTAVCPWTFAGTKAPTNAVKIAAVLIRIVAPARTPSTSYALRLPCQGQLAKMARPPGRECRHRRVLVLIPTVPDDDSLYLRHGRTCSGHPRL